MRHYLPEILLGIPAVSGLLALCGWLWSQADFWLGLGLLTLQAAPLFAAGAVLLWVQQGRRKPGFSWRVPLLLLGDLVLAAGCIWIALSAPQAVTLKLDNRTGQRLTQLELRCAGDDQRHPELARGAVLEWRCFPRQDGLLSLHWREQKRARQAELGYITPGLAQHFALPLLPAAVGPPR
ncbi:MAG: hypothetical protein ACO1RX_21815 [Candidatus Sericytochromatia bacterium]